MQMIVKPAWINELQLAEKRYAEADERYRWADQERRAAILEIASVKRTMEAWLAQVTKNVLPTFGI